MGVERGNRASCTSMLGSRDAARIGAGLMSGVITSGLFTPWDRALYLSVKDHRRFLSRLNWMRPYEYALPPSLSPSLRSLSSSSLASLSLWYRGFFQTIAQRSMASGLYFPLYDIYVGPMHRMAKRRRGRLAYARTQGGGAKLRYPIDDIIVTGMAGNLASVSNGVMLHVLTSVKYHTWGSNRTFSKTVMHMWKQGGSMRPFLNGISLTVARDGVFGFCYAVGNHSFHAMVPQDHVYHSELRLLGTISAASIATIASSPLNYARNMKFATPAGVEPPSSFKTLRTLYQEARALPNPFGHVQARLRIFWGTARVATGMTVGQVVYDWLVRHMQGEDIDS